MQLLAQCNCIALIESYSLAEGPRITELPPDPGTRGRDRHDSRSTPASGRHQPRRVRGGKGDVCPLTALRCAYEKSARPATTLRLSRSAAESFGAVHDPRRDEDHELVARIARTTALEQDAEDRDVTEERDLVQVAAGVARED